MLPCLNRLQADQWELERILAGRLVTTVFQPIVALRQCKIIGYEALSRGPAGSRLANPEALFQAARENDRLWDLELLCRRRALERATLLGLTGNLFLNVDPQVVNDRKFRIGITAELLARSSISPHQIIFEITEKTAILDYGAFCQTLRHYTDQGYRIALDDTGAGYSGIRTIAETKPHFIKLDMELVRDIDKDGFRQAVCSNLVALSQLTNMRVIAEGVETWDELRVLARLGVEYVQGYLLGRPSAILQDIPEEMKQQMAEAFRVNSPRLQTAQTFEVGLIARMDEPVAPEATGSQVVQRFEQGKEQGLVVVAEGKPVGLIMKHACNAMLATPYGNSLFLKRPASLMMDRAPLIVDFAQPIAEVSSLAMARREENLYDYIIVTREGEYLGVVTVKRLLEHATQLELNYARHLNPLTGLPGNLLIEDRLTCAAQSCRDVAVIYVDIGNFKAYNDVYGFENGDRIIQLLAKLLAEGAHSWFSESAFIGHVGGDDYILVIDPLCLDLQPFCREIISAFDQAVAGCYNLEHYQQGFVWTADRDGTMRALPLMCLSMAVVQGPGNLLGNPITLAEQASRIKRQCRTQPGSGFRIFELLAAGE